MGNFNQEQSKSNSYLLSKVAPSFKTHISSKTEERIQHKRSRHIEKSTHLKLIHGISTDGLELSFPSISDVSIECVQMHDGSSQKLVKALLLSVTTDDGSSNFYLIDINQIVSGMAKTSLDESSEYKRDFEDSYHGLSLREQKVLYEVSKGSTSNEIASKFFISTNTVKNHRKNIKRKLNFDDAQEYSRFLKWSLEYLGNR